MDLTSNTTTITTTVKTPEPETETPTRIQLAKPISFSNGVLKRHNPLHHHHHHVFNNNSHHPVVVIYKECLKNHAATLGGHAVDGCGEFMPSPTATPADPTSLKCAACGCHRNFHRREPEEPFPPPNTTAALEYQPHHRHHPLPPPPPQQRGSGGHSSPNSPSPPPISSAYYPASAPHMLLALSAGLSGTPVENVPPISVSANPMSVPLPNPNGRKRHRTKFTQDQKERMLEFAERVGWKIQKRDEKLISDFCTEVGVEKGVLKVWMHNNKNTFGKRSDQAGAGDGGGAVNGAVTTTPNNLNGNANNGISFGFGSRNNTHDSTDSEFHLHHESSNDSDKGHTNHNSSQGLNNHLIHNNDIVSAHVVVATNGSSSST